MSDQIQSTQPTPTLPNQVFRTLALPFFRVLYRVLSQPEISGYDNIPKNGPHLITANHLSYYDPPLAISYWPYPVEVLGAASQMAKPGIGHIMRCYGTHAVRRDSSASDLPVIRLALSLLRTGYSIFIMPEGQRNPDGLGEAQLGAAYLASKADIPIIPVAITGTEKIFQSLRRGHRQKLHMQIGPQYRLETLKTTNQKQALQTWTDTIMNRIADLLPREYRGIYSATLD